VLEACKQPKPDFKLLYNLDGSPQDRLEAIAKKFYGADKVVFEELAQKKIDLYVQKGFGHLPICVAKTQYSLSDDESLKGAPTGFDFKVRDVRLAAGAGYLYAICGNIQTIPGLATVPGYLKVDIDTETGEIEGLF
jgi:methylenetetrahydrofolate dehydrogenase (NADP+)/methenyltetrahydrofolate cyclohydrolase/formyltetrahydrofolate synthetase